MIVTCPSCAVRYRVDAERVVPQGRALRCARCATVWQAEPGDDAPDHEDAEILPPEPPEPRGMPDGANESLRAESAVGQARMIDDGADVEIADAELPDEATARARAAAGRAGSRRRRRRSRGGRALQAFVLGAALALVPAAVHYRADVVRAVPASAGLYAGVGLPVNLRGLEFRDVAPRHSHEDGLPVLVVEGEIVNLRERRTQVPALRFGLHGGRGEELYVWTVEPRQGEIEPGGTMRFRSRLAAPPGGAEGVRLRFTGRARHSGGDDS